MLLTIFLLPFRSRGSIAWVTIKGPTTLTLWTSTTLFTVLKGHKSPQLDMPRHTWWSPE